MEGIGFVFTDEDDFAGIDLDDCIDETGRVVPAARGIVDRFNSYTEVSPSGKGVKIFIKGTKPEWARCKSKKIKGYKETEVYDHDRFFTVTSQHLAGTPTTVEHRQAELEWLCHRLWPQSKHKKTQSPLGAPVDLDDAELIRRASNARNGEKFKALWSGDTSQHGGDNSAADLALCSCLAFWMGDDADRIDRLFRRSGLYRPKWDEKRGPSTYGAVTIARAIESCTETYKSNGSPRIASTSEPSQPDDTGGDAHPSGAELGHRDPESGRLVLSPTRTQPTAEAFIREFHSHPDRPTLVSYAGTLMEWRGNRYIAVEDGALRQRLHPWLHDALCWKLRGKTMDLVPFDANPRTVAAALETLRAHVYLPGSATAPCWLDESHDHPSPLELLPCRTVLLHLATGRVLPVTPLLFTINAIEFDFDEETEPPELWIKFLEQLFGDDIESCDLLQEWFGYCLIADTSQQKILVIIGPKRSGKGTLVRILRRLVGEANVVAPMTRSLAGNFGLQPLLGKSLATISDARFSGEGISTVVERLLNISGEDAVTVDRKFMESVTMKLSTRFMILSNELPVLPDSSGALIGRFLVLRLTESFYGREDLALTEKLLRELPGILLWAVAGWRRLKARGHFLQPRSNDDVIQSLEDISSPVTAFVRERCVVAPDVRVMAPVLFEAWSKWCKRSVLDPRTSTEFGRDLGAAFPTIKHRRTTGQRGFYQGITLVGGAS